MDSTNANTPGDNCIRLSIPAAGRSLAVAAEQRAEILRIAVDAFRTNLSDSGAVAEFLENLKSSSGKPELPIDSSENVTRAAWALANIWLLSLKSHSIGIDGSIEDAEEWFIERATSTRLLSATLPAIAKSTALAAISELAKDPHVYDLLPYMLEPNGLATRLTVMKNPATKVARAAKKKEGIFYTPADVAEYMVRAATSELAVPLDQAKFADPACGSGVFLLAQLNHVCSNESLNRFEYACRCLFGFDCNLLSIESCAFVLLHRCIEDAPKSLSPLQAWAKLRQKLAYVDSLFVRRRDPEQLNLNQRTLFSSDARGRPKPIELGAIFPEAANGFELIVGNPPYAQLSARHRNSFIFSEFDSLRNSKSIGHANLFPLFIEQVWRLGCDGRNSSALVVPLSIAYHRGQQFVNCRKAMSRHGGEWRVAFFDREPHALFGEEVKTRNAILIRDESITKPARGQAATIHTGPLRKWTSRIRCDLFSSIGFTNLGPVNIANGIPKLAGDMQAEVFTNLINRSDSLASFCKSAESISPIRAFKKSVDPKVFVATTAYNFINVYRRINKPTGLANALSENRILSLSFESELFAWMAFAILSSRLTFWLWHVRCDGFHVPRWFVESVPFGPDSFSRSEKTGLASAGKILWDAVKENQIISVNKGKATIAFRPLSCEPERNAIDQILIEAAGVPYSFLDELRHFVRSTVVVDESDNARQHLATYFRWSPSNEVGDPSKEQDRQGKKSRYERRVARVHKDCVVNRER